MKQRLEFTQDVFAHCCGIYEVGDFTLTKVEKPNRNASPWEHLDYEDFDEDEYKVAYDGTGIFVSTFVDAESCRVAYEKLCAQHRLLYQTKPRVNRGTRNEVFLCVFLHKDAPIKVG